MQQIIYSTLWHIAISFLILFFFISPFLFRYTKDKSFKYYFLYTLTLLLYLSIKEPYGLLDNLSSHQGMIVKGFNYFLQILFYTMYYFFGIHFIDLPSIYPKQSTVIKKSLLVFVVLSYIVTLIGFYQNHFDYIQSIYFYLFIPYILLCFLYMLPKAIKTKGASKYYLLLGVIIYIIFGLLGLYYSIHQNILNNFEPLSFFLIGVIVETLAFTLGLAYKVKVINDEKLNHKDKLLKQNHEIERIKLKSVIRGEERERKRIAQELHDGINGDLAAIKYQMNTINKNSLQLKEKQAYLEAIGMLDNAVNQVRHISHNLAPPSLLNFSLVESIREHCIKLNTRQKLKINFQFFGKELHLEKDIEILIYRIVQELLTNIIEHAKATEALVELNFRYNTLKIIVEDNGIGFDIHKKTTGLGLQNIKSRIHLLQANYLINTTSKGTTFEIEMDLEK